MAREARSRTRRSWPPSPGHARRRDAKVWTSAADRVACGGVKGQVWWLFGLVGTLLSVPDFAAAQETPKPESSAPTVASEGSAAQGSSAAPDVLAAQKKLARDLAWAGVDLFNAGRFQEASEKFAAAYAIQRVPTVGLWSARALREQGKLVESSERYVETLLTPKDPAAPEVTTPQSKTPNENTKSCNLASLICG